MRVHIPAAALLCAVLISLPISIAAMTDVSRYAVLGISLALVAGSLGVWWYDASRAHRAPPPRAATMASPFTAGMPRMHAAMPGQMTPARPQHEPMTMFSPEGMHASLVVAVSGVMGVMLFLGLAFAADAPAVVADAPAADATGDAEAEAAIERVPQKDVPAPAAETVAETTAPVPQPAVTADASPAQQAAAAAAASAASDSAEPRQATPIELSSATPEAEEESGEAESADEAAADDEEEPAPVYREYTIQPGDSAYEIAQRNGLSVTQLLVLNNLKARDILQVGQVLLLPPLEEDGLLATVVAEDDDQAESEEDADDELLLEE